MEISLIVYNSEFHLKHENPCKSSINSHNKLLNLMTMISVNLQ